MEELRSLQMLNLSKNPISLHHDLQQMALVSLQACSSVSFS